MARGLRIFVAGSIGGAPHQGGLTWVFLHYVLGLRSLGHDVYFVDPVASGSLRPSGARLESSVNAVYFQEVTTAFGLSGRAALLLEGSRESVGLRYQTLLDAARGCDLLINISGLLTDPQLLEVIPRRLYLDLDPAFTQLWHAVQGVDMRYERHTDFATVGLSIGSDNCNIPTCGRTWMPTLQPVLLSAWPPTSDAGFAWTTVGNWRGYGSVEYLGTLYGQKAHSVRQLIDLPGRTQAVLRPALAIHPGEVNDLEALGANNWRVIDPAAVASTPTAYRTFVQHSRGELGIAKSGYVASRCGWFSDRSICYLASGRPVIAQDTGFTRVLPTGEGLLSFTTAEEAAAAIDAVESDYARHRKRAREIAEDYFKAERVLAGLLDRLPTRPVPAPYATAEEGASAR